MLNLLFLLRWIVQWNSSNGSLEKLICFHWDPNPCRHLLEHDSMYWFLGVQNILFNVRHLNGKILLLPYDVDATLFHWWQIRIAMGLGNWHIKYLFLWLWVYLVDRIFKQRFLYPTPSPSLTSTITHSGKWMNSHQHSFIHSFIQSVHVLFPFFLDEVKGLNAH